MPELQRCVKCRTVVPISQLGENKVCLNCMEVAITNTNGKPVILVHPDQPDKPVSSITEAANYLNVSVSTARNRLADGKDTNGWVIKNAPV